MKTSDVAKLAGVSVRTLHHYDQIGLLCPRRNAQNGYREYTQEDIAALQQILFFRECGIPLERIAELLGSSDFDRTKAFELQKKALLFEKKRIDTMLETLEASIKELKGEITMNMQEKFNGFHFGQNPYEEEARRLFGNSAINASNAHIAALGQSGQQKLEQSFDALFKKLALLAEADPKGKEAQQAMAEMYRYFNTNFGVQYTPEAFAGLGRMYVEDERFTQNIDRYAEGLSVFLKEAMGYFAENVQE
ncbi:MAG: MerR family transcriptional regulator [Christensenellaceae bacterium]|jgi:DNA-binding transcriptional MerR regulator